MDGSQKFDLNQYQSKQQWFESYQILAALETYDSDKIKSHSAVIQGFKAPKSLSDDDDP